MISKFFLFPARRSLPGIIKNFIRLTLLAFATLGINCLVHNTLQHHYQTLYEQGYFPPLFYGALNALLVTLWYKQKTLYPNLSENFYYMYYTQELIYEVDPRGTYLSVNRSWRKTLGYNEWEVPFLSQDRVIHPQSYPSYKEACECLKPGAEPTLIETMFMTKEGRSIVVEGSVNLIQREDKSPIYRGFFRDITKRREAECQIRQLAYYDPLTGLPNRTLFNDRLSLAMAQADRNGSKVGLLFLDLDRFKRVNDFMGHDSGDQLLKKAALRMQECLRKNDTVARFGGDEFIILAPDLQHEIDLILIAKKLLGALAFPFDLDNQEVFISASIGIAVYPGNGQSAETLLKNADLAMYAAKELGGDNYQFFSQRMNLRAAENMEVEIKLRRALDREEFLLHYQPQISLESGKIVGLEALIRWQDNELGIVPPEKFIPLAEETGMIVPIGEWVLKAACRQLKEWQDKGLSALQIAINLSGRQFSQADFAQTVKTIISEAEISPHLIELEITESILMNNAEKARCTLRELRDFGVNLAIDDFGMGYSSLNYLKNFPINRLKIDKSFVRDITTNPNDATIVKAIIALAHSLNIDVIAEGVETREQMEFLDQWFCQEMQGYLFGKPLSAEETLENLKKNWQQQKAFCPLEPRLLVHQDCH